MPKTQPDRGCSFMGCDRLHYGLGLCHSHWQQQRRGYNAGAIRSKRPNGATLVRDELGRKECITCGEWKKESYFSVAKLASDGLYTRCKSCVADNNRWLRYGVTVEQVRQMLALQDNVCAVCKFPLTGKFYVDHDHNCCPGKRSCSRCVRGLLCIHCNSGLGSFKDSPEFLINALNYLNTYSKDSNASN